MILPLSVKLINTVMFSDTNTVHGCTRIKIPLILRSDMNGTNPPTHTCDTQITVNKNLRYSDQR